MTPGNGRASTDAPGGAERRWRRASPIVIVLLGLALYVPGINWGLPSTSSWSQDTIAGLRTVGAVRGWPETWSGRYPPLHYLLNAALYAPVFRHWEANGQIVTDANTGMRLPAPPREERVGLLLLLSRLLSVAMACGAGIGLWMAARLMARSEPAALVAALGLMIGADFTYFAHLGNVDIPSMFWFAWSVYFYALALRRVTWLNCAGLGLFAALALCTKDGVAGVYPGMAIGLVISELIKAKVRSPASGASATDAERPAFRRFDVSTFRRFLLGLAAFVLPFLFINGLLHGSDPYMNRMHEWFAESGTIHSMQHRYPDQLSLAWATVRYGAGAVGWPLLAALAAAVVHAWRRHRSLAVFVLLPAVSYYVIIIAWQLHFVYARFLFPPLALLAILLGVAAVDWMRSLRIAPALRRLVPLVVALPTLGYAAWVDVEMMRDTRYEAEAWFRENVPAGASLGIFCKPQYLPRLHEMGHPTSMLEMKPETFERPAPEYLVLTSYDYEEYDDPRRMCQERLVAGEFGYEPVIIFAHSREGDPWSWLALAGWGVERPGKISPTLIVLQNVETSKRRNVETRE